MQFKFPLRRNLLIAGMVILPMLLMPRAWHDVIAKNATATGVLIVVPTLTATDVKKVTPTPSLTATDAAPGLASIEAKSKDTGANLRAAPSTESEKLGTIFPGQFYGVIGRFGKWLEIQYNKSPTGLAWVYEDIVNVTGLDPAAIATLSPNTVPSPNVATGAAQATLSILTTTPGGPETATALQASATGVFTRTANGSTEETPMERTKNGTFAITLDLDLNREYQYRYLVNSLDWHNDWEADKYLPNPFSGDNSVVTTYPNGTAS